MFYNILRVFRNFVEDGRKQRVLCFFYFRKDKNALQTQKKYALYTEKIDNSTCRTGSDNFMKKILMCNIFDETNEE